MSTIYPATSLSGVVSGTPPDPDSMPAVLLPDDGEAATIGPIADAFGQIMSEMAWLKAPKASMNNLAGAIRRYRNVLDHTRFAIDHHGFPSGRIFQAHENWLGVDLVQKTAIAADAAWAGNWRYDLSSTGHLIEAQWAGAAGQPSPCLHMQAGTTIGTAQVYGARDWVLRHPDQVLTWQTELVTPNISDIASVIMEFGFGTSGNDHGARFVKRAADVNWQLYSNLTGVYTDLGVASYTSARQRLRLEVVGQNVADVGAAWIVAYINGAQVAFLNYTNLGTESLRPWFKLQRTAVGAGTTFHAYLTSLDVCSSMWPSDVFL